MCGGKIPAITFCKANWHNSGENFHPNGMRRMRYMTRAPPPGRKPNRNEPDAFGGKTNDQNAFFKSMCVQNRGSCGGQALRRSAMFSQLHNEKRAGRGMVSLKSTKWKITDTFSEDFGMMKGQHVAGWPWPSTTLSTTPPPPTPGSAAWVPPAGPSHACGGPLVGG